MAPLLRWRVGMAIDPVSRNRRRSLDFVNDVVRTAAARVRSGEEAPKAEPDGWAERAVQAVDHVLEQIVVAKPAPQKGATASAGGSDKNVGVFANTAEADPVATANQAAIDELLALPAPEADGRGTESVATFLDAMAAREAGEDRPEGTPDYIWNTTRALQKQDITLADVEHYLVHGTLPDAVDESGAVTKTGAERFAKLENAATQRGSWTSVNSLTFLVQMRRASVNTRAAALATYRDTLPADDPMRAELDAAIDDAEALTKSLKAGLSTIYTAATSARETKAASLVGEGEELLMQAAALRDEGKHAEADQLEAEGKALLDSGASIASSEAAYRARQSNAGWNAGDLYALAAQAQTDQGVLETEAMVRSGTLSDEPSSYFGDVADAGNGVAGAASLIEAAKAHDADDDRVLALEGDLAGGLAVFHQAHLVDGGYHDLTLEELSSPSGEALVEHRSAYLEARATQLDVTEKRLDLIPEAAEVSPELAAKAAQIAKERRVILEEVTQDLARGISADEAASDAKAQLPKIEEAVSEAKSAEDDAYERAGMSGEDRERIVDQTEAWLGDWAKTSGEETRDKEARSDARLIEDFDEAQAEYATAQRLGLELTQNEMETRAEELEAAAGPALADANLVTAAFASGSTNVEAYGALRAEADDAALDGEAYLDQLDATMPEGGPEHRTADLMVAGLSLDLARYWTTSTDLDNVVTGHSSEATERLDKADDLLGRVDETRTSLMDGNAGRLALAVGTVEVRSSLAEANADYRIGEAARQIDLSEGVLGDLDGDLLESAEARVGGAAISAVMRHEGRFDEVLAAGGYEAGAADDLLAAARKHLDGTTDTSDATILALYQLEKLEGALENVDDVLVASQKQVENGHAYAEAQIMKIARMEIANAQAQVSSVITGATWLLTFGQVDMKEDMADAGEEAASWRVARSESAMTELVDGADQLLGAWDRATREGEQLEMLHSLRILTDDSTAYDGEARGFFDARMGDDDAWKSFVNDAIDGGQIPVASAFEGTVLGFESTLEKLGSHDVAVLTPTMHSAIESGAARLEQVSENMTLMVAFNLTAEFFLGLVLTGGLAAEATAGRAAHAANAIGTATEAANAARSLTLMGRAGQALANFKAAHGVLYAMGTTTLVGGGMMGASWTAKKAFGANTGVARGFDIVANIAVPLAALRAAKPEQVLRLATQTAKVQQNVGRMSSLMSSLSKDAWKAAAIKYGPDALIGGTQTFSIAMVTPWLAEKLDLRTEGEQMLLGLALNTLSAGGLATGYAAFGGNARAKGIAEGFEGANVKGVAKALDAFDKIDGMPSAAQLSTLEAQLTKHLGATGDQRAQVSALVEGMRVERATAEGFSGASIGVGSEVTARDAVAALDSAAEQLFASRLETDPSASRAQAYQDAADGVTRALVDGAPALVAEVQIAATDRANAITIAEAYATPAQRAKAEAVLAEALPSLREGMQNGAVDADAVRTRLVEEAGLSPTAADEAVFAAQYQLALDAVQRDLPLVQAETAPLSNAEIAEAVFGVAEQAGLTPEAALALSDDLVAKAGFVDWVRSLAPQSTWSASMRRDKFLEVAQQKAPAVHAEMSKLTVEQFEAIAMGGAIPNGFFAIGDIPGFAALAAQQPWAARGLADATTLVGVKNGQWAFKAEIGKLVAAEGGKRLQQNPNGPKIGHDPKDWSTAADLAADYIPHLTPSSIVKDYWLATFENQNLVSIPKYNLRPMPKHDGSGAFNEGVVLPGGKRGKTTTIDFANLSDVKLLDANLQPITDMTKVLVFSGHGSPLTGTISGKSPKKSAALVAEQIHHAHLKGDAIEFVLLDACHQRDKRLYFGKSHAQLLKKHLNAELKKLGLPMVEVLAAKHSGPTYGYGKQKSSWFHRDQNGKLRLGGRDIPTDFRPADHSKLFFGKADAVLAATVGTLGGLGVLTAIILDQQKK